jgi:hypothetical protein
MLGAASNLMAVSGRSRGGWPIVLCVALVSGCGPALEALSVAQVDCQESGIEISDVAGRRGEKTG